ncbi:MAG: NUDIX hydrolase, partial [Patescibacteria group bacterium]
MNYYHTNMDYKYCPNCSIQYDHQGEPERYACSNCNSVVYLNSKPTASTLITDGNRVLLGKRRIEPAKGRWDVIGGFLNLGEKPEDGAVREAKEETGLSVELGDMLGFFMDSYGTTGEKTLNICFIAEVIGGVLTPGDDIEELRWFSYNELPERMAFKNGEEMVQAWLETVETETADNAFVTKGRSRDIKDGGTDEDELDVPSF